MIAVRLGSGANVRVHTFDNAVAVVPLLVVHVCETVEPEVVDVQVWLVVVIRVPVTQLAVVVVVLPTVVTDVEQLVDPWGNPPASVPTVGASTISVG